MNKTIIENRLKNALNRLYHFDQHIISNNSHEPFNNTSISDSLGALFYEDWNVDVEYNRNLEDRKTISNFVVDLRGRIDDQDDIISGRKSIYPDIIVHKRGFSNNLLVVEVKIMSTNDVLNNMTFRS